MLTIEASDDVLPSGLPRREDVLVGSSRYRVDLIDAPDPGTSDWAHPGVCVTQTGTVLWTAPDGITIRSMTQDGCRGSRVVDAIECHGLASDHRGGLWIADPGRKAAADGGKVARRIEPGRVTRVDSAGDRTQEISDPLGGGWRPSGIALHEFGTRSDGCIWVADGYGEGLVHCFSTHGEHLWSSDGSDSGTPFRTPHGLVVDDRGPVSRLLVADRGNARIVALTLDGALLGTFGEGELTSPSNFALDGPLLWVTELFGATRLLDADDRVVASFGDATESSDPSWPNAIEHGRLTRPEIPIDGMRAPHGIAVTQNGEVYVTEWIIGGRVTSLVPMS